MIRPQISRISGRYHFRSHIATFEKWCYHSAVRREGICAGNNQSKDGERQLTCRCSLQLLLLAGILGWR